MTPTEMREYVMSAPDPRAKTSALSATVKGARYPRFDNGSTETIYAVEVDHYVAGRWDSRWEQIWVLRDEAMAQRVADALNGADAARTDYEARITALEGALRAIIKKTETAPFHRRFTRTVGEVDAIARAALLATPPTAVEPD